MIPIKDLNPTDRRAVVTVVLIALNIFVYFFVQHGTPTLTDKSLSAAKFSYHYAAIPCEVTKGRALAPSEIERTLRGDSTSCETPPPPEKPVFDHKAIYLAILFSMFFHGGLLHLGGNMLFLWVFGNNIEDRMGRIGFVVFYLIGGLVAAAAQILVQANSTVPVIGASGAIAAVMGAYLVLFPNAPVRTVFIFYFILFRDIPAKWLLLFWLASQFFISPSEGVAWVAHVAGFAFGAVAALVLRSVLVPPPPPTQPYWTDPWSR